METTYEFTAYNTKTVYGYGSEDEAGLYLGWLNRDREINLYEMAKSSISQDEADTLAINLRENLGDLDLIEAGDN